MTEAAFDGTDSARMRSDAYAPITVLRIPDNPRMHDLLGGHGDPGTSGLPDHMSSVGDIFDEPDTTHKSLRQHLRTMVNADPEPMPDAHGPDAHDPLEFCHTQVASAYRDNDLFHRVYENARCSSCCRTFSGPGVPHPLEYDPCTKRWLLKPPGLRLYCQLDCGWTLIHTVAHPSPSVSAPLFLKMALLVYGRAELHMLPAKELRLGFSPLGVLTDDEYFAPCRGDVQIVNDPDRQIYVSEAYVCTMPRSHHPDYLRVDPEASRTVVVRDDLTRDEDARLQDMRRRDAAYRARVQELGLKVSRAGSVVWPTKTSLDDVVERLRRLDPSRMKWLTQAAQAADGQDVDVDQLNRHLDALERDADEADLDPAVGTTTRPPVQSLTAYLHPNSEPVDSGKHVVRVGERRGLV